MVKQNPFTKHRNKLFRDIVQMNFPEVGNSEVVYHSLSKYIIEVPHKFYSVVHYHKVSNYINSFLNEFPNKAIDYLISNNFNLNSAAKNLEEINSLSFHDGKLPKEIKLLNFIDTQIHFNYLKLIEGTYKHFLHFLATISRLRRNKGTDGLDIFNCVEEMPHSNIGVCFPYDNLMRNGIAHGGVEYESDLITYTDKKGNSKVFIPRKVVSQFDKLLDICNGINLAFRIYFLTNSTFLLKNNVRIPENYLLEEIKTEVESSEWKITNFFNSILPNGRKQVIVYVENDFYDLSKVNLLGYITAIRLEKYFNGINRINLNIQSSTSKFVGWANYNVDNIKELRKNNYEFVEEGKSILEDGLLFFIPKVKLPKWCYYIGGLITISKSFKEVNFIESKHKEKINVRFIKFHFQKNYCVIEKSAVFVKQMGIFEIKTEAKKILSAVIREKNNALKRVNINRYKKTKFIKVNVYNLDVRIRDYQFNTANSNLIFTIQLNKTKIKRVLPKGIIEDLGNYYIVWNNKFTF